MKKRLHVLLVAMMALSMLAGCGKSVMNTAEEVAYDSTAAEPAAPQAAPAEEYLYDSGYQEAKEAEDQAQYNAEAGGAAQDDKGSEVSGPQAGRKLITTMNINVETESFDELMGNLERQIAALGGYIENSDQWNGSVDYYGKRINDRNASLTIRIPTERLDSFLTIVEESSNITSKGRSVEDVTLAYVDLESHKKALLTAQERLLELLEKAETVEDLIAVEEKLTDVRYQLESMESQLRTYDNRINYSTVCLYIQEVTRLTPQEEPTTWGRIKSGFAESVYHVCIDIRDFFVGLLINIPYIILWLVILAIVLLVVFALVKYEKRNKAKRMLRRQEMAAEQDGNLPCKTRRERAGFAWKRKKESAEKKEE